MKDGKNKYIRRKLVKTVADIYSILMYLFMYFPVIVMVIFSFNSQKHNIIWKGFTVEWYVNLFSDTQLMSIVVRTLVVSISSTILSTIIGTMAVVGINRYQFKGKNLLTNLLYIPIIVPEIVLGVALLIVFMGMHVPLNVFTMIIAHISFCAPFVVIVIKSRMGGMSGIEEEASMDLGANRRKTFFCVTIPMLAPGIMSAAFMAFTLSFDDLVISNFVSGPDNTTLPIYVQSMVKTGLTPEINALSSIMLGILLIGVSAMKIVEIYRRKKAMREEMILAQMEMDYKGLTKVHKQI